MYMHMYIPISEEYTQFSAIYLIAKEKCPTRQELRILWKRVGKVRKSYPQSASSGFDTTTSRLKNKILNAKPNTTWFLSFAKCRCGFPWYPHVFYTFINPTHPSPLIYVLSSTIVPPPNSSYLHSSVLTISLKILKLCL